MTDAQTVKRTAYCKWLGKRLPAIGETEDGRVIYDDLTEEFAKLLSRRIDEHRQNVIVVDGPTGSGKSTFAINLCRAMDPDWRLRPNYIYSKADLAKKLRNPQSPVSLFDEGSVILNSKNVMRGDDKAIIGLFDTMRSRGWTTVICLPSVYSLNSVIRTYHTDFLCRMPMRAPVYGYDERGFVRIYRNVRNEWSAKSHFTHCAWTVFKPLSQDVDLVYQVIKSEHQNVMLKRFIGDEEDEEGTE